MANYVKATNFTAKDSLPSGNSGKIVKGTEIDIELTAIASAVSSKADLNSPALTGTPTAPTAAVNTSTTQLATTAFVTNQISTALTGIIAMWSGAIATIPTGWVLCDGTNGTPDLRNKFIIGAHSDTTGVAYSTITGANTQTGGSKDAIVISHTHTASNVDAGHTHFMAHRSNATSGNSSTLTDTNTFTDTRNAFPGGYYEGYAAGSTSSTANVGLTSSGTASITTTINSTGSSGTNANLPPYYALAFIMKTA